MKLAAGPQTIFYKGIIDRYNKWTSQTEKCLCYRILLRNIDDAKTNDFVVDVKNWLKAAFHQHDRSVPKPRWNLGQCNGPGFYYVDIFFKLHEQDKATAFHLAWSDSIE